MAEAILRSLRDGRLAGEHARALSLGDSLRCHVAGAAAFAHFLTSVTQQIAAGKHQSIGIVVVAAERSPGYYLNLLRQHGVDGSTVDRCVRVLDCYSDPLGWKHSVLQKNQEEYVHKPEIPQNLMSTCTNVKDTDKIYCSIIELGTGFVKDGKAFFNVAIDSISYVLKHASVPAVSGMVGNLRSHDLVSSIFWLIHSDLYESRVSRVFEYLSTMVASVEPISLSANSGNNLLDEFFLEEDGMRAKFQVRLKRRNGRVKHLLEELHIDGNDAKFLSTSAVTAMHQSILPKVQFKLQLSEKERNDRKNVVLPFEHQGNGEKIQIYDGRRSLSETLKATNLTASPNCRPGEIHYIRDSDDEQPDSDEDPDDDLDI